MKIFQKMENNAYRYYLSVRRQFKTVVELVSFYERNDLGENFVGYVANYAHSSWNTEIFINHKNNCLVFSSLNQSLQWPYYEEIAEALYDFASTMPNQLSLVTGCRVTIISKEGDANGWWRGKTDEKVCF